ncbi:MAG TPA: hypothetical protein VNY05_10830 [Candidatus Acidoferrales bacterium]|nr:hypothetical protein [Candidatus Acidoferrales bacterium]
MKIRPLVPDIVSFARRFDLTNRWLDPANRHWGIQDVGVMHFWVTRDLSAEHKADYASAMNVLLGAAGVVTGYPFPVPGDHCLSCPTSACRPDDLVRPPDTCFASNLRCHGIQKDPAWQSASRTAFDHIH